MQKPHDLIAFLNQSNNQDMVHTLYERLLELNAEIRANLEEVESFEESFLQQTKCMLQYFLDESDLHASIGQRSYMDLVYRDEESVLEMLVALPDHLEPDALPKCSDYYDLDYSLFCFDHLDGIYERNGLKMSAEEPLKLYELGIINLQFAQMLVTGMIRHPTTWQYYALASYYWRLQGEATEAVECARRALHLSPRKYKDVPLLSLGTILQRSKQHEDAVVILEAATDFAPNRAENYFALGNSLFFLSEFNRSMLAYDKARTLDETFKARVDYIENALLCFKYAKTKLDRFDTLITAIPKQLKMYGEKKQLLKEYLSRLLDQQVPLREREYFKQPDGVVNEKLAELVQKRAQYCSTRISTETNEPELFCDFVHDIHMKLETDEIRIEMISRYLEQTAEVMKTAKSSLGVFINVDVNKLDGNRFGGEKFVPGGGEEDVNKKET